MILVLIDVGIGLFVVVREVGIIDLELSASVLCVRLRSVDCDLVLSKFTFSDVE